MCAKHKAKLDQDSFLGKQRKIGAHLPIIIIAISIISSSIINIIFIIIITIIITTTIIIIIMPDVQLRQC